MRFLGKVQRFGSSDLSVCSPTSSTWIEIACPVLGGGGGSLTTNKLEDGRHRTVEDRLGYFWLG